MKLPKIIQGGMGAGVSAWTLARAVSSMGHLGVVSGTALDLLVARRLQLGDPGGHVRRALESFPIPHIARDILQRYFIEGGKSSTSAFKAKPMVGDQPSRGSQELLVAANFVEVFLAKENHDGRVGINYLEKIQTPTLPSLYGAMLAGVDVVIVGAGIPKDIPEVLDRLCNHQAVQIKLHVTGATKGRSHSLTFDPQDVLAPGSRTPRRPTLERPLFFPIVASASLASMIVKRANGSVDGLIIEGSSAGGHNAPPRGRMQLDKGGEPIYGARDSVELEKIRALGLPFWLAGSYGSPEKLARGLEAGATGVQVGTLFAFCAESGLAQEIKSEVLENLDRMKVFTDPLASPTGFPFKVLLLPGSNSRPEVFECRRRTCDLGYLREAYESADGSVGWRCPAEDPREYVSKGGTVSDTHGRKCLCNALVANIGLGQIRRDGQRELPLVTCGDELSRIDSLLAGGRTSYSAYDVIDYLLSSPENEPLDA